MNKLFFRPQIVVAGLILLAALAFAIYTQHGWEDYWITFRASKNLSTGQGLVFSPGESLHTFTSPLGVLLPAALNWLVGNQADNLTFWLFRIVSAGMLSAGLAVLFLALRTLKLNQLSYWLTLGLIGLDTKIVDFSINGMEIGLLIFFAALVIHGLLVAGPRQIMRIGIGWAGLMWPTGGLGLFCPRITSAADLDRKWIAPTHWAVVAGARPNAAHSVMLETLGYIGFYSGLRMLDYPGLASKEMVETRQRLSPAKQNQVYRELKPDWLVLRPHEAENGTYVDVAGLQKYYELVQVFDATEKINSLQWLLGRPYLQFDEKFFGFSSQSDSQLISPE